jgi:hypothetical protein
MVTILFLAFLLLSACIALLDWRRGWYLAILCGVLQDPARKLTPGTPVVMTFSMVLVYLLVLVASQASLRRGMRDLAARMSGLYLAASILAIAVAVAAVNGLITFGLQYWKVPLLSLIIYTIPIPAALLGYVSRNDDRKMARILGFYAAITAVALIGVPLEYNGIHWRSLGLVGLTPMTYRYLPGIEIRMLSGFYRAPDVMGWHAAMLTIIGVTMSLRAKVIARAWPWMFLTGWGFINCILSGRRKAVYMVAVFALVFVWRYAKRLTMSQIVSFVSIAIVIGFVLHNLSSSEQSDVYVRGTATTSDEIFARLEGGFRGTIEQSGLIGAGLGAATQGTYHLAPTAIGLGWQEGGLGKLTMELGVPGLIAVALFAFALLRVLLVISRAPDEEGTSQLMRVALFAIAAANFVNFLVSAQAYSDPLLTLLSAYLLGTLLGTATINSRAPEAESTPPLVPARA